MLRFLFFGIITVFLLSHAVYSQEAYKGSLAGKVNDGATKLPIASVTIRLLDTKLGAQSNESGKYKINNIPSGTYTIECKRIGYTTARKTDIIIRPGRITELDIELNESVISADEVTIRPDYFSEELKRSVSTVQFSNEEIRRAPGSFGDISRIVAGLPSTAKVDDQSNALIVRGGSPIENGFFVDNIEITNINHFPSQGTSAGSTSIIPVDMVNKAEFSAGGFSSMYGDKLSSVMNIELRNGNKEEFDAQIDLNVIGFGGLIEGPFASGKGTYIVAARRSYLDLIAGATGVNLLPSFGDAQLKLTYELDNSNTISLLGIFSDDHISSDSVNARENKQTAYGSDDIYDGTFGINWKHFWGEAGFSQTSVAYTRTKFKNRYLDNEKGTELLRKNSVEEYMRFRNVNTFFFGKTFSLECGAEVKYIQADNDIFFGFTKNAVGDSIPSFQLKGKKDAMRGGLFFTGIYSPINELKISMGIRSEYSTIAEAFNFSPKIQVAYSFSDFTTASLSYGIYYQGLPLLMVAQNPSLQKPKDMMSQHIVASIQQLLSDETRLIVEGYYKEYSGFPVDPTEPRLFAIDEPYDRIGFYTYHTELLMSGKARSYGVEASVQKKLSDNFYGMAGISWFRSQYAGYDGIWRNRVFDNQFVFSVEGGYTINKEWELSARWIYAGGRPYTPFDINASTQLNTGVLDDNNINNSRFPAYHSLNVRADKRFFLENSSITVYLSIWNTYNRENAQAVIWNTFDNRPETVKQFGLLPIFGIEWEL